MPRVLAWALAAVLVASPASAQDADEDTLRTPGPWAFAATVGLNLSQSAYSDNWSGGDKGSVVWVLGSDLSAERQFSRSFNLDNLLQLAYGQTSRQVDAPGDPGRRIWDSPEKSTDLVQLETVGRFTLDAYVDPFFSLRLDTQFQDESDPAGALTFNPLRLKETAGIARVLKKTQDTEWITRLGFGFRQTLGRSFVDSTGTETDRFSSNDGGFEWQTVAVEPILNQRVLYKGKLLVFVPVFYSKSDELEEFDAIARELDPNHEPVADYWRVPDVNFQNTFNARITKLLSVNLYLQFVYNKFDEATNVDLNLAPRNLVREVDRGVRKSGQFKQTLALGLSYTLF